MDPWQQPPNQSGWNTPPSPSPYGAPGPSAYGAPGPSPYGQPSGYVPPASGGTAITAAVLSFLGAAAHGVGAVSSLAVIGSPLLSYAGVGTGMFVLLMLLSLAVAAGLTVGGIILLQRKLVGRIIIAASCGLAILGAIVSFAYVQHLYSQYDLGEYRVSGLAAGAPSLVLTIIMAGTTIALALVPPTTRWCLSRPARAAYQPPGPW